MNESLKKYLDALPNVQPVDSQAFGEYLKEMSDSVVPQIDEALREQQRLNAESRVLAVLAMRPSTDPGTN
jgi:hypothetical protein